MTIINKTEALILVSQDGDNLQNLSPELRDDKEVVCTALHSTGYALEFASERLRNDKEVILVALANDKIDPFNPPDGSILERVGDHMKKEFGDKKQHEVYEDLYLLLHNNNALPYHLKNFINEPKYTDKNHFLTGVKIWGASHLQDCSYELRNNKEIALICVRMQGNTLEYVSNSLKNDRDVVTEALKKDIYALKFASKELKNDHQLILEAVKQDGLSLQFASEKIKDNKDMIFLASKKNIGVLSCINAEFLNDKQFMLDMCNINPQAIFYASKEIMQQVNIDTPIKSLENLIFYEQLDEKIELKNNLEYPKMKI